MKNDVAAAPAPEPRGEFHIPSLDGIRAISFLIVFVSHTGLSIVPGGFGVTIFFFLSGFLITTLMRMEQMASGRVSLRDFYLRRVLRILPPFYVVLLLAVIASTLGLVAGTLEGKPMLALVAHYTNYWAIFHGTDGQPAGTGVYWSLAVEEHFYVFFPLIFLGMQRALGARFRAQAAVLLALCGVALLWRYHLVYVQQVTDERTFLATDTRFDSILLGCALALGANPMLDAPRLPRNLLLYVAFPAGLLLLLLAIVVRDPGFRSTLRYTIQGIGLCPVFVAAMRAPDFWAFRWLNGRRIRRLGALSYSLYLVHLVVLYAVEGPIPDNKPLRAVVSLALSFAIAEVVQRYVERPCARLRRRLAHATWLSSFGQKAESPAPVAPTAQNDLGFR